MFTFPPLDGPNSPIRSPARKAAIWTPAEEVKFLAGLQVHKLDFDTMHTLVFPNKTIQELHSHFLTLRHTLMHPSPRNDTHLMKELKETIDSLEPLTERENKENLCPLTNFEKEPVTPQREQVTEQETPSVQDLLRKVHLLIEKCFHFYLTKEDAILILREQHYIEPIVTRTVWDKLEEQNPAFFQQYNERLIQRNQTLQQSMEMIFSSPMKR